MQQSTLPIQSCNLCGVWLPQAGYCSKCRREYNQRYYYDNLDKYRKRNKPIPLKRCAVCDTAYTSRQSQYCSKDCYASWAALKAKMARVPKPKRVRTTTSKWRGPRGARDPIYISRAHTAVRKYWLRQQAPCAICHRAIDYTANGNYDPLAFHLDHYPVSIAKGREMGWTDLMLSAITNTRPTHRHCNTKHGQRDGQRRQHNKIINKMINILDDSRSWNIVDAPSSLAK